MKSTFGTEAEGSWPSFASGFEGLLSHGSINRTLPRGVVIEKAACPNQRIFVSCALTRFTEPSTSMDRAANKPKTFINVSSRDGVGAGETARKWRAFDPLGDSCILKRAIRPTRRGLPELGSAVDESLSSRQRPRPLRLKPG